MKPNPYYHKDISRKAYVDEVMKLLDDDVVLIDATISEETFKDYYLKALLLLQPIVAVGDETVINN